MTKVLIPMADYGHDPTETAIPFSIFKEAGFDITFATENGEAPKCDSKMLYGVTGAILGAPAAAKKAYTAMETEAVFQHPIAWSHSSFSMDAYDLVFLPGGHDKGVRQIIDSEVMHQNLQNYFPKTKIAGRGRKVVGAICHGVQVLAFTPATISASPKYPLTSAGTIEAGKSFRSIIHACKTTALPGQLETFIYQSTRLALGDYYKSYGAGTPNVQDYVTLGLDNPAQFEAGPPWYSPSLGQPFIVADDNHRYISARFPPDAEALARKLVEMVNESTGAGSSL